MIYIYYFIYYIIFTYVYIVNYYHHYDLLIIGFSMVDNSNGDKWCPFVAKQNANGECCIVMFDCWRVYVIRFNADYLILMVILYS